MKHSHVFMRFPEGRAKALTFSFDDGSDQDKWLVGLMKDCGLKATFNLNMGLLPEYEDFDFSTLDEAVFPCKDTQHRMTFEETTKLFRGSGMEVATHGYVHAVLPWLEDDAVMYEILRDREMLEVMMGESVRGHAYAQGAYDDRICKILKTAGIVYGRTAVFTSNFNLPGDFMRWNPTCQYHSENAMALADAFLNFYPGKNIYYTDIVGSKLFYIFAHSFEFDVHNNYGTMEALAKKLSGHEDVWYCTNMDYYRYATAFNSLDFNLERTTVYNPSAISVWIYINGKTYEAKPGIVTGLE